MKMPRFGITIITAAMGFALAGIPAARAQEATAAVAAPLPDQLATATSVFISYRGGDGFATTVLKRSGNTSLLYNQFYAAMKKWGRYQLATSPAHADLILGVRFTVPLSDCGKSTNYSAQVEVAILDGKTHVVLWTLDEPVEVALRIATWERNLSEGVTNVVGDMQRLVAQPVTADASGG